MVLTSIVIPARNEEHYIRRTLESFLRQQFKREKKPYELIVVTNGCSPDDKTADYAEDLGAKVIELEKGNVSVARNTGAEQASGDVIVFNDADTLVAPNYVAAISRSIQRDHDYGSARFKSENWHPVALLYSFMTWGNGFIMRTAGGNMFTRHELFDNVGGFNPELFVGEDTDLSRRMKAAQGRYDFLQSTYLITSLRKFNEIGYLRELFINQVWPYLNKKALERMNQERQ